jgi:hypothetical protein
MGKIKAVVAISGNAGSGKDSVAEIIQRSLNRVFVTPLVISFEARLKDAACELLRTNAYAHKWEEADMGWGMTGQTFLARLDDFMLSTSGNPNILANLLAEEIRELNASVCCDQPDSCRAVVIVENVRTSGELKTLLGVGVPLVTVRVARSSARVSDKKTTLDDFTDWDFVLDNDGSPADLQTKVVEGVLQRLNELSNAK